MKYLLDTHVLLWAAGSPEKLSSHARNLIENMDNLLFFSTASVWEISIKASLGRADFQVNPRLLRRTLLEHGYEELNITSHHVLTVHDLPPLHKDPFDRILIAQAIVEEILLLTNDNTILQYTSDMIQKV
jgi:PIN domain nuclease of toxin-antitoxin system